MKKILSLLLVVAGLGYTSCDDETPKPGAAPTITLSSASDQNIPGAVVSVTVSVNAPNKGATLQITGVSNPDVTLSGAVDEDVVVEIAIPANAVVGSTINVAFTAVDAKNLASLPAEYTITVGNPIESLTGNLTTRTLVASKQYLLKGQVFIPSGVTLTIPAGTVIKGEKASKATLIVSPGGVLVANGTAAAPVIFTSNLAVNERDRGDWGGIVMLGNAYVNQGTNAATRPSIEGISPAAQYGTPGAESDPASVNVNENENSGTLTYVRIEYGGIELSPNNETNSLTLGAIGRGTTINNIQASFGGDDGFEWFGGTVDAKYLISFGMWDDDFDTDFGYRGRVQYGLVVRYGPYADQSGSNAFESDTQGGTGSITNKCDGATFYGCTQPVFSNITVLGPRDFNTGLAANTTTARTISASYQQAMHIRRASMISIFNSVFAGFPTGWKLDEAATFNHLNTNRSRLGFNVLMVPNTTVIGANTTAVNCSFTSNISEATFMNTYWVASNTVLNPTGAAGWSPVPATPAGSINPYTGTGLVSTLFWAGGTEVVTNANGRGIAAYPANPNFALEAGGTLLGGADFSDVRLANAFFTGATFKGGFNGTTDWTDTWTNFVPLTTPY